MITRSISRISTLLFVSAFTSGLFAYPGDAEFLGQFTPGLVANVTDFEKIIFKFTPVDKLKGQIKLPPDAHLTATRLIDPRSMENSVLALLVEEDGENPFVFVDTNGDKSLADDEKYPLKQAEENNPYLWETTVELKLTEGTFKTCPIFLRYFRSIRQEDMKPDDRLVTQSTGVLARGIVEADGKKIVVQYAYDVGRRKVDPQNGWLGVDIDGNGDVDMDELSPEAAKANEESVIFRAGNLYVSTKKADVGKNQIVMRGHEQKDYKRAELYIGKEFPEFTFTDFDGKKRKFSEYRGKYILLDVWGFWCPPCRKELPYLREANRRFKARNLELIGLNTDEEFTIDSMKKGLNDAGMNWTHAQFPSVLNFLKKELRISSFPSTFLISPEGKILSMSRSERDELDLRGQDLLKSLDETLPVL